MCQNSKWITNKYLYPVRKDFRSKVYVSCGHCKECLQEKANLRAARIQREFDRKDIMCLVVTLTYDNKYVPYFYKDEADMFFKENKIPALPLRRDYSRHLVRVPHYEVHLDKRYKKSPNPPKVVSRVPSHYSYEWSCDYVVSVLDTLSFDYMDSDEINSYLNAYNNFENKFHGINYWKNGKIIKTDKNKVPILYYRDVQLFFKRFRKRLNKGRRSNPIEFRYFATGEIGETYQRPHWHILLFFRPEYRRAVEDCVYTSWPFCDLRSLDRSVEPAKDPAHYVASYVNMSADIPPFFTLAKAFKPSWHYSKVFGFDNDLFSYTKVSESLDRGRLRYSRTISRNGKPTVVDIPYPKYVLSRYFPKFRGFSLLDSTQLYQLLDSVRRKDFQQFVIDYTRYTKHLEVDFNRTFKLYDTLTRRVELYGDESFSYFSRYYKAWTIRFSESVHILHDEVDILQCYDNIKNSVYGETKKHIHNHMLAELKREGVHPPSLDPREFPINIDRSKKLIDQYDSHMKVRKVLSEAYNK